MTANVGNLDRVARLVLGLVLILAPFLLDLAIFANPLVKWGLPVVGLVFAGTALIRFCPLYAMFGIRTRREG